MITPKITEVDIYAQACEWETDRYNLSAYLPTSRPLPHSFGTFLGTLQCSGELRGFDLIDLKLDGLQAKETDLMARLEQTQQAIKDLQALPAPVQG